MQIQVGQRMVAISWAGLLLLSLFTVTTRTEAATTVSVSGKVAATLTFPTGGVQVVLIVQATAQGDDPNLLTGAGGHVAFAGGKFFLERSMYDLNAGSTDGNLVVLWGTISDSNASGLIGAPVVISAQTSGDMEVTVGPIPGGPFAGQTHLFTGSGTVIANTAP